MQMAWRIDAIPGPAQNGELPRSRIRHLNNQPAMGFQQPARFAQINERLADMFEHVKHGNSGEALRREWRSWKVAGHRVYRVALTRQSSCLLRQVQAHRPNSALAQHPDQQPASAAHIEYRSGYASMEQCALDKPNVIFQHQPAIHFFEARSCVPLRVEPVIGRVIIRELIRAW